MGASGGWCWRPDVTEARPRLRSSRRKGSGCSTLTRCLVLIRQQLEAVPERVVQVKPRAPGYLGLVGPLELETCIGETTREPAQDGARRHAEAGVRLGCRHERIGHAHMKLVRPDREPASSAGREGVRLLDLGKPEQTPIEVARRVLAATRRRHLNMVEADQPRAGRIGHPRGWESL